MKLKNNVITIIEIGTTKIICLIAAIDNNSNLKIIGYGHQVSYGFRAGSITDIKLAESAIFKTVQAAEKMAGINIEKAVININDSKTESYHVESILNLNGHPIINKDITKLIDQALEQSSKPDQELVSYFPIEYFVDNEHNIKDPKLMFGNILGCKIHIATAASNLLLNLFNCFARCHIDIQDFILSSYAASLACLTNDEMEIGSILIDIGGASTSIAVFKGGSVIASGGIMIGGMHITSDISHGLSLSIKDAERLKILHGNSIDSYLNDYEVIDIHLGNENEISYIKVKELVNIINPRVEEIFELIRRYITSLNLNNMALKNIVLTGGTSQLNGIKDIASRILDKNIRVATPKILEGLDPIKINPIFSASIGMMISSHNKFLEEKYKDKDNESKQFNYLKKIFNWF